MNQTTPKTVETIDPNQTDEPKVNESPEAAFSRIATRRCNNALKQIHLLGNCANKSSYSYDEEQVDTIISSLLGAVNDLSAKFEGASDEVPTVEL